MSDRGSKRWSSSRKPRLEWRWKRRMRQYRWHARWLRVRFAGDGKRWLTGMPGGGGLIWYELEGFILDAKERKKNFDWVSRIDRTWLILGGNSSRFNGTQWDFRWSIFVNNRYRSSLTEIECSIGVFFCSWTIVYFSLFDHSLFEFGTRWLIDMFIDGKS